MCPASPTDAGGHEIEVGECSWGDGGTSVRSRRRNRAGGFNAKSPEIPISDLPWIIEAAANENVLDESALTRIIVAASDALARRTG